MPGQGGPAGHVGRVSQAQRLLGGRRPLADVGHRRRSGAERGCTSTAAPEVPAPAVAGLDGPIVAPARHESTQFAAVPGPEVAAVRGV